MVCKRGYNITYDFTNSNSQSFGNNMASKGTKYCIYSGDVNQEGNVDLNDVLLIYNDAVNFITGYIATDVNGDNVTDLNDDIIAYNNSVNFVSKITP